MLVEGGEWISKRKFRERDNLDNLDDLNLSSFRDDLDNLNLSFFKDNFNSFTSRDNFLLNKLLEEKKDSNLDLDNLDNKDNLGLSSSGDNKDDLGLSSF